tara:strand:- start:4293 stop:4766 length:474 start_codon:yes stop_codon:yes gene_type:complete
MNLLLWGQGVVSTLGYLGVFVVVLLFSMGLTLPLPTSALVIFAGALFDPFYVGLSAALASTIGESVAFGLGYGGSYALGNNMKRKYLKRIKRKLQKYPYVLPMLAVLPIPSMVLGLSSGMLKYNKLIFVLSVLLGRLIKMMAYAYVGYLGLELLAGI